MLYPLARRRLRVSESAYFGMDSYVSFPLHLSLPPASICSFPSCAVACGKLGFCGKVSLLQQVATGLTFLLTDEEISKHLTFPISAVAEGLRYCGLNNDSSQIPIFRTRSAHGVANSS